MNGKQTRVRPQAIAEEGLDQPCVCGHLKKEHAQFIDNQIGSASYVPERRHCLRSGCECVTFKPNPMLRPTGVALVEIGVALQDAAEELARARSKWPNMHTAHEGYAIILEEVDELWSLVKVKQNLHDRAAMRAEAIQIAAMAIRFAEDICSKEK